MKSKENQRNTEKFSLVQANAAKNKRDRWDEEKKKRKRES
jgi:hypothetical protein